MALTLWLGFGCQDDCESLCDDLRDQLDKCIVDWPYEWADLDAKGPGDFDRQCKNEWQTTQSKLEPRELQDGLLQCQQADVDLASEGAPCDRLRALYVE